MLEAKKAHAEALKSKETGGNVSFDHIICKSLTVANDTTKAHVDIALFKSGSGIWLSTGRGQECIHMVHQPHCGMYFGFHTQHDKVCTLAIAVDEDGESYIQVGPKEGSKTQVRIISLRDLVAAIQQVMEKKEA